MIVSNYGMNKLLGGMIFFQRKEPSTEWGFEFAFQAKKVFKFAFQKKNIFTGMNNQVCLSSE